MIFLCYLIGFTLASIYVGVKELIKRVSLIKIVQNVLKSTSS